MLHASSIKFLLCCKIMHPTLSNVKNIWETQIRSLCFHYSTYVLTIFSLLWLGTIHFWMLIDSTAWYNPPRGTIMIHSQNGICLRPIIMPYSDNVSAGIVSDWISSAPLEWTLDRFGKRHRWNHITGTTLSRITCEIERETNAVSQSLVFQFRDSVNRINTYSIMSQCR